MKVGNECLLLQVMDCVMSSFLCGEIQFPSCKVRHVYVYRLQAYMAVGLSNHFSVCAVDHMAGFRHIKCVSCQQLCMYSICMIAERLSTNKIDPSVHLAISLHIYIYMSLFRMQLFCALRANVHARVPV